MKHKLLLLLATAILGVLSSCGQLNDLNKEGGAEETSPESQQLADEQLSGLSVEDTLKEKYKKALFSCEYKTSLAVAKATPHSSIKSNLDDSRQFSWDLLAEYAPEDSFTLKIAMYPAHYMGDLKISVTNVRIISSLSTTTADGKSYRLRYTPEVAMGYSKAVNFFHPSTSLKAINETQAARRVGEVQDLIDGGSWGQVGKESFRDDVRCWLDLVAYPKYKHQKVKI